MFRAGGWTEEGEGVASGRKAVKHRSGTNTAGGLEEEGEQKVGKGEVQRREGGGKKRGRKEVRMLRGTEKKLTSKVGFP